MCGRVSSRNKLFKPGDFLDIKIANRPASTEWGIKLGSNLVYNARQENLFGYWKDWIDATVEIDMFYEGGHKFFLRERKPITVAALVDRNASHVVLVTRPSSMPVRMCHHRMPQILEPGEVELIAA